MKTIPHPTKTNLALQSLQKISDNDPSLAATLAAACLAALCLTNDDAKQLLDSVMPQEAGDLATVTAIVVCKNEDGYYFRDTARYLISETYESMDDALRAFKLNTIVWEQ